MTNLPIAFETMLTELRNLSRGNLLIIAERALELIPLTQLDALLGDIVQSENPPSGVSTASDALLDELRRFYDAGMAGHYYEAVQIRYRRSSEQSHGTDAFIAEFDRLLRKCLSTAEQEPLVVREGLEGLFGLLRRIDGAHDDVIDIVDDGGSSDVGVNWRIVLPVYFRCLASTASAEEFAPVVDLMIRDFVEYDRSQYLAAAHAVASVDQQKALDVLRKR
jgi:hypothetical protein